MADVSFLVNGEISQGARLRDVVKAPQTGNLLRGDFGDLRFIHVKCGYGLGFGTLGSDFIKRVEQRSDSGQRARVFHRRFAHTERLCEMPPKHGVRRSRIELFSQVFVYQSLKVRVAICAGCELLQVIREGTNVLIVLLGVKCERILGELACSPSLVERMLQQVIFFNQRIKRFDQSLRLRGILGHRISNSQRIMAVRKTTACYRKSNQKASFALESSSPSGSFLVNYARRLREVLRTSFGERDGIGCVRRIPAPVRFRWRSLEHREGDAARALVRASLAPEARTIEGGCVAVRPHGG